MQRNTSGHTGERVAGWWIGHGMRLHRTTENGKALKGKIGLVRGKIDPDTGLTQAEIDQLARIQDESDQKNGRQ